MEKSAGVYSRPEDGREVVLDGWARWAGRSFQWWRTGPCWCEMAVEVGSAGVSTMAVAEGMLKTIAVAVKDSGE